MKGIKSHNHSVVTQETTQSWNILFMYERWYEAGMKYGYVPSFLFTKLSGTGNAIDAWIADK